MAFPFPRLDLNRSSSIELNRSRAGRAIDQHTSDILKWMFNAPNITAPYPHGCSAGQRKAVDAVSAARYAALLSIKTAADLAAVQAAYDAGCAAMAAAAETRGAPTVSTSGWTLNGGVLEGAYTQAEIEGRRGHYEQVEIRVDFEDALTVEIAAGPGRRLTPDISPARIILRSRANEKIRGQHPFFVVARNNHGALLQPFRPFITDPPPPPAPVGGDAPTETGD